MNKQAISEDVIFMILMFVLLIGLVSIIAIVTLGSNKECKDRGIEEGCSRRTVKCYDGCESLGYKLFKYDDGGFGSPECWCLKDGEPKQIW